MKTLKMNILILVVVVMITAHVEAEELASSWFLGGGVSSDIYGEDNAATGEGNTDGFELHAGYQFNNYLKLIVGYKKFGTSSFNRFDSGCQVRFMDECTNPFETEQSLGLDSFYIKIRPEWEFANNFRVYADLAMNSLDFDFSSSGEITRGSFIETFSSRTKQTSSKISWGFGVGYNIGRHELTVGFENYGTLNDDNGQELLVDSSVLSAFSLQYNVHF